MLISILFGFLCYFLRVLIKHKEKIMRQIRQMVKQKIKMDKKTNHQFFQGNEHGKKTRVDLPFRNRPMQRQMRNVFLCPRNG